MLVSRAAYGYSRHSFDAFDLPISGRWPALMPKRGDVVVFRLPRDQKIYYVKRVVGLPDDHVQMVRGTLSINGQLVARWEFSDKSGREATIYIERLPDGTIYRIMKHDGDDGPLNNTPSLWCHQATSLLWATIEITPSTAASSLRATASAPCLSNLSLVG